MRILAYGDVYLASEMCPNCKTESFVLDGKLACCGLPAIGRPTSWKRMSQAKTDRIQLSPMLKAQLLHQQRGVCAYCEIPFRTPVYRDAKVWRRTIQFDHFVPWSYCASNHQKNVVAACSICNQIKSWLMFKDLYECQTYIMRQWRHKGFTTKRPGMLLSDVREAVPEKTVLAKVLFENLPVEPLGQKQSTPEAS